MEDSVKPARASHRVHLLNITCRDHTDTDQGSSLEQQPQLAEANNPTLSAFL